jgi:hypothetical protein
MDPGPSLDALRSALSDRLDPGGEQWLRGSVAAVASSAEAIRSLFPQVGRRCGRGPLALAGWTVDDAARTLLAAALPLTGEALAAEVGELYRYGDAAEKRAVLRALPYLDLGDLALPLVADALRTNDTRLVAAALGPYGAEHLDPAGFRQAVLKCVFMGVPLAGVAGLERRADAELARMLRAFARERVSAGRTVPEDVWLVVPRTEVPPPEEG